VNDVCLGVCQARPAGHTQLTYTDDSGDATLLRVLQHFGPEWLGADDGHLLGFLTSGSLGMPFILLTETDVCSGVRLTA
jgi:hypothetical protein